MIKKEELSKLGSIAQKTKDTIQNIQGQKLAQPEISSSIESQKKELAESCYKFYKSGDYTSLKNKLMELSFLNKQLQKSIGIEMNTTKLDEKIEKKEITTLHDELIDNEQAKKIISGILETLPPESAEQFRHHISLGIIGLEDIRANIGELNEEKQKKHETITLLLAELGEFKQTIEDQNTLITKTLNAISTFQKKISHSHSHISKLIINLFKNQKEPRYDESSFINLLNSIRLELKEGISLFKNLGYRTLTAEIDIEKKICWLEDEELKLTEEINLLCNQFIIPKLNFPSLCFASYTCSKTEAMHVATTGYIGREQLLAVNKKSFVLAHEKTDLYYMKYIINDCLKNTSTDRYSFVFPVESIVNGRFFQSDSLTQGELLLFDKPTDPSIEQQITAKYSDFDEILKKIDTKYEEWVEGAAKLNIRFRENWTQHAKNFIKGEFTKRWLKEVAVEYEYKENIVYNIISALFEKEDLERMNKAQLIRAIEKSREFYKKIVGEVESFITYADITIEIRQGIFFAPRSEVFLWEHMFTKAGFRPNVLYYDNPDIREAVSSRWCECKTNNTVVKSPKTREVQIYELGVNRALLTTP